MAYLTIAIRKDADIHVEIKFAIIKLHIQAVKFKKRKEAQI